MQTGTSDTAFYSVRWLRLRHWACAYGSEERPPRPRPTNEIDPNVEIGPSLKGKMDIFKELIAKGRLVISTKVYGCCDNPACMNDVYHIHLFPDGEVFQLCVDCNRIYVEKYKELLICDAQLQLERNEGGADEPSTRDPRCYCDNDPCICPF